MTSGFVLGRRKDGLGARLLMLLNCQWLARQMGAGVRFQWEEDNPLAPEVSAPNDLFSDEFCKDTFLDDSAYQKLRNAALSVDEFLADPAPDRLRAHLQSGKHIKIERGFAELDFAWDTESNRDQRLPEEFGKLPLNPNLQAHVSKLTHQLEALPQPCTAYHIRRGDLFRADPWKHKYWRVKYLPLSLHLAHMAQTRPASVLIFSDSKETLAKVRKEQPDAVAISELIDASALSSMQRDFLELSAMARAGTLIAPAVSAFSLAAGRLSGKGHMTANAVLTPESKLYAHTKTLEELKSEMKNGSSELAVGEQSSAFANAQEFWARYPDEKRDKLLARIGAHLASRDGAPSFTSLYTAIQALYMQDWPRVVKFTQRVLDDPDTWKQDYALACAVMGLALCRSGKQNEGLVTFLDGYWQKPLQPDIYTIGSHLFYKGYLKPNGPLFFDRALLDSTRLKAFQGAMQIRSTRLIRRRPLDFSALAVEWPYFVIDKDMAQTVEHREMLQSLDARMTGIAKEQGRLTGAILSFRALVAAKLGNMDFAVRESRRCQSVRKSHALIPKRHAEIMSMTGAHEEAAQSMEFALSHKPDRADFRFLASEIWRRAGNDAQADHHLEIAAGGLHANAMILHRWATRANELGRHEDAQKSIAAIEARAPLHRRLAKTEV